MGQERLAAANSLAIELGKQVELRQGSGRLTDIQAAYLQAGISQIRSHVTTALQTPLKLR